MNTLRYIHANPKAAGMQEGFFYDFSNYGVYERLGDDGLTTWHLAFLTLGCLVPSLKTGNVFREALPLVKKEEAEPPRMGSQP
ncbi:MAG: hypothetical protein V7K30_29160 [Nostoc sp.]